MLTAGPRANPPRVLVVPKEQPHGGGGVRRSPDGGHTPPMHQLGGHIFHWLKVELNGQKEQKGGEFLKIQMILTSIRLTTYGL